MNAEIVAALEKWLDENDPLKEQQTHLSMLKRQAKEMDAQRMMVESRMSEILSRIKDLESHLSRDKDNTDDRT